MFFKDINSWSEKKLFWIRLGFWSLYFAFSTIIPVIIIICNYAYKSNDSGYRLPMWWLIFGVILITLGIKKVLQVVGEMDEQTRKDQIIKFSIQMVAALIVPAILIYMLYQLSVNWELAKNVLIGIIASYSVSIVIEHVCCKSLDVAKRTKRKAKEQIAVNEAAESLKK